MAKGLGSREPILAVYGYRRRVVSARRNTNIGNLTSVIRAMKGYPRMSENTQGAVIEIIERTGKPDREVIVPNDVRINGQSLYCSADHPVVVHEISTEAREAVYVTLTLLAKRVTIAAESTEVA